MEAAEPPRPRAVVSAWAHWEAVLERRQGLREASPEVTVTSHAPLPSPATACPGDSFLVGSDIFSTIPQTEIERIDSVMELSRK